MGLSADFSTLVPLSPDELQASLEVFRRGQRSSLQRRRAFDRVSLMMLDDLDGATEDVIPDSASVPGLRAGRVHVDSRSAPDVLFPDLSHGQVLHPSIPRCQTPPPPPPRTFRSVATQLSERPPSPFLLPAPGLSIQELVDFVRLHPQLSAGQSVLALEELRGSRFSAAERRQLVGFLTTAIAAEKAFCRELVATWDTVSRHSLPSDAEERQLAFNRLLLRVQEGCDRFLPDADVLLVGPGSRNAPGGPGCE